MRSMQVVGLVAVTSIFWVSIAQSQSLTTAQAKAHEGETGTVCGKVAGERTATSSKGEPTFVNLDAAYPNQVFTILVWGDDERLFAEPVGRARTRRNDLVRGRQTDSEITKSQPHTNPTTRAPA